MANSIWWHALAAAVVGLTAAGSVSATSQGPVADGPYSGTLPCADCSGIRTTLTLYTMGNQGAPLLYRMTRTYLGTRDGDRTVEYQGKWSSFSREADTVIRIAPNDDEARQSFRRVESDELLLLDRQEQAIETRQNLTLTRDVNGTGARLEPPPVLVRGTLRRGAERLLLMPCGESTEVRVRDVSPESVITTAVTGIGFDRLAATGLYFEAYGERQGDELHVSRLNRAGTEMSCPQQRVAFQLSGNEPAWSLLVDSDSARFVRPGFAALSAPPLSLSWRWPGGRQDRAEARLFWSTESGALTATLTPRICRDTMADAVYGFTAAVRLARPAPAQSFAGCAFLGTETLP